MFDEQASVAGMDRTDDARVHYSKDSKAEGLSCYSMTLFKEYCSEARRVLDGRSEAVGVCDEKRAILKLARRGALPVAFRPPTRDNTPHVRR